jgi:hypothetical protein
MLYLFLSILKRAAKLQKKLECLTVSAKKGGPFGVAFG